MKLAPKINFLFIFTILLLFTFLTIHAQQERQWEILNEGFDVNLFQIDFVSDEIGWIFNGIRTGAWGGVIVFRGLLKTTDGGKTWKNFQLPAEMYIIDFVDDSVGWAIIKGFKQFPSGVDLTVSADYGLFFQKVGVDFSHIGLKDVEDIYPTLNDVTDTGTVTRQLLNLLISVGF